MEAFSRVSPSGSGIGAASEVPTVLVQEKGVRLGCACELSPWDARFASTCVGTIHRMCSWN